jgi:hypothetical protein
VDFDGDGDLDLYVAANQSAGCLLYRNDGQGVFTKITTGPFVNTGPGARSVAWADLDNDGRMDLFLGTADGPGWLFHQEANGTVTRSTLNTGASFAGAWADYDNDAFLDLFVAQSRQSIVWHNDGQGGLSAVTPAGIDLSGTGIAWADFDNDDDQDVFVTESGATGGGPSRLYRNDGGGVFTRITTGPLVERSTATAAAVWGDYDNDRFLDLFLSRRDVSSGQPLPSFLFHNNGHGAFTQVEQSPFTDDTGSALGASWADYDNDGWLDLFVCDVGSGNNRLYHNNGDGTFTRVLSGPVPTEAGESVLGAWGDYDRDGFLDLFVTDLGAGKNALYHNDGNSNAWISIRCVGTRSNRSAIGAKVRVKASIGGRTFWQMREINSGGGAGSSLEAHFGLGDATQVETVRIEWPSRAVQEFHNVSAKTSLTVTEPSRLLATNCNAALQLTLQGGRGFQYDVQTSLDLVTWSVISTVAITNVNGLAVVTNVDTQTSDRRFYRAVLR